MFASVDFRGEKRDVTVDHDGGYEWDTNAHEIEWHFTGLTAEQHDELKITDEEEDSIYVQLALSSDDRLRYKIFRFYDSGYKYFIIPEGKVINVIPGDDDRPEVIEEISTVK